MAREAELGSENRARAGWREAVLSSGAQGMSSRFTQTEQGLGANSPWSQAAVGNHSSLGRPMVVATWRASRGHFCLLSSRSSVSSCPLRFKVTMLVYELIALLTVHVLWKRPYSGRPKVLRDLNPLDTRGLASANCLPLLEEPSLDQHQIPASQKSNTTPLGLVRCMEGNELILFTVISSGEF